MVMSGNGESVVFVHARPGDESRLTGGTIARLRSAGAPVLLLFEHDAPAADTAPELDAAASALGALDCRLVPSAGTETSVEAVGLDAGLDAYFAEVLGETWATAVVIGAASERMRAAAVHAAHVAGIPAFLTRGVAEATGERLTAIDVSDQVDEKLAALAAYPSRWTIDGRTLLLADGTRQTVSGAETYSRLDAPHPPPPPAPPTLMTRLGAGALGLVVGAVFAVLGTIAHQATIEIGALSLPIGLVIALTAACALLVGLRLVLRDRLVVGLTAAGLLLTSFTLSLRGVGGSVLVPEGLAGTLWTIVPAFVAALVLAWPTISVTRRTR
ncbi:hypothetical protein D6T64_11020 [Cryobacterium melibiosiphilum]|uniref:N-acetylglucosaminyl deacetylase, LmbE family n=1 Tax=Cryobacterium melibiosiphilum TaxID=995039 RepID=A0A3A5ME31_9MICO|nr:hypothetical protein [Cryobacterium melibiosiphilum]RJT88390.1 hypothetical protein D6T64_11020 [Cryobacterium melibiosiphilum]